MQSSFQVFQVFIIVLTESLLYYKYTLTIALIDQKGLMSWFESGCINNLDLKEVTNSLIDVFYEELLPRL